MGDYIKQLAQTTGGNIVTGALGGIMGQIFGGMNDKRQLEQQQKLQELQIKGEKEMADYNMNNQYQMWLKTNYPGQIEQLNKAGLNPALLYGGGGGGGTTVGSPSGNVTGATASQGGGGEIMGMSQQLLQNQLIKAQTENIEADTANKQADTANKPIIGENVATNTASLIQGIQNQKAQAILTNALANTANLDAALKFKTFDAAANFIEMQTENFAEVVKQAQTKTKLDQETVNALIQTRQAEAIGALLDNALTRKQITLTDAQTGKTIAETGLTKEQINLAKDYIHTQILDRNVKEWNDANTKEMLHQMGLQVEYNTDISKDIIKGITSSIGTIITASTILPKTPLGTKPPEVTGFKRQ